MTLAVFAVSRYLIVMLFCVTAYAIGRASVQRLPFASRAEEIAICTAFGLGVLSQIVLIAGLFGWLTMGESSQSWCFRSFSHLDAGSAGRSCHVPGAARGYRL